MFGLFKPKLPIDDGEFEWLLACTKWFAQEFEGLERLQNTPLVRAHPDFFPPSRLNGHDRAVEIFEQVKAHANMSDWPCDLLIGDSDPELHVGVGIAVKMDSPQAPAGTFGAENGRVYISYNPAQLARPHDLVATFAHELAHYLMHSASSKPPGGEELEEHATDLCAVLLGFGAFSANGAKNFDQFQTEQEQGWQMRRMGYLSELSLVTAYALFVILSRADREVAEIELKPYLKSPFKKALAAIDDRLPNLAAALELIDLADWR
jgi:hypothetical protein